MNNKVFDYFVNIFNQHGYRIYMIGSASRDFLLDKEINDYDFVTDATPSEVLSLIKDANDKFAKYGTIKTKYDNINVDIVSLRKENNYADSRHPDTIEYIKDINEDFKRRDFTINSIYIDEKYNIIDPSNGYDDLKNGILRMIGDPYFRLKEDPLRIIRAYRFTILYDLTMTNDLKDALLKNKDLIKNIRQEKLIEEFKKMIK